MTSIWQPPFSSLQCSYGLQTPLVQLNRTDLLEPRFGNLPFNPFPKRFLDEHTSAALSIWCSAVSADSLVEPSLAPTSSLRSSSSSLGLPSTASVGISIAEIPEKLTLAIASPEMVHTSTTHKLLFNLNHVVFFNIMVAR